MRISHKHIYIAIATIVAVAAAVSRIYYGSPVSQTAVTVEEQQYQLLTDGEGTDSLLLFTYPGKDTLIATVKDSLSCAA